MEYKETIMEHQEAFMEYPPNSFLWNTKKLEGFIEYKEAIMEHQQTFMEYPRSNYGTPNTFYGIPRR